MSAVSKTYTFVPGTDIESSEVNQNFDDLVGYTNAEVIVRDGSKAFTAIPTGPGTNPTSANQFARKQYVDDREAVVTAVTTSHTATLATHTTDLTKRPTINNNATNVRMISAATSGTTDANGDLYVAFPAGHLTTCTNVVAMSANINAAPVQISTTSLISFTNAGFTVRVFKVTSTAAFATYVLDASVSAGVSINYIATGT